MAKYAAGFIGVGNMGGALALAAAKSGQSLLLADRATAKAEALAAQCKAAVADNATVVAECRFVFLGVKPQFLAEVLAPLREVLAQRDERVVLVSMAAGVSMERVSQWLGGWDCPLIRIMPNTPAAIGEGMILYAANDLVTPEDEQAFLSLMNGAGQFDRLPEPLIDAGSALSGCGPAFVYLFAEALADGAVACGLPRDKALLYAAQTLAGAAGMMLEGEHPGVLKDAVCSPGGSTIVGVQALENSAFRGAVMNAVTEAFRRTRELGK